MPEKSPWPNWFRATASAVMGGVLVGIPTILWFGDVRTEAREGASLRPRVESLERSETEIRADARAATKLMDEVRSDVKELLRRTAK